MNDTKEINLFQNVGKTKEKIKIICDKNKRISIKTDNWTLKTKGSIDEAILDISNILDKG